ncbi:MAG TPA: hypothetical protein VKB52_13500, partial [Rhodanobacteraceae bacterium]|nr:hypothetical protein [Rhodanobacteraceae bacterium]
MTASLLDAHPRVIDPVNRASEVIFGLLMALSFTGSLSVAAAGQEEVRTMMLAALGCNLAWGVVDGVMYLVATAMEQARRNTLLRGVRESKDVGAAHAILEHALPGRLGEAIGAAGLEELRVRIAALPDAKPSAHLDRDDFVAALAVFVLVVLSTFPVVVPFLFLSDAAVAIRLSNAIALVTLFIAGHR